jgi:hypothetical protein
VEPFLLNIRIKLFLLVTGMISAKLWGIGVKPAGDNQIKRMDRSDGWDEQGSYG